MISIEQNGDGQVVLVLDGLMHRMDDMRPALEEIGHDQVESIKSYFATGKAPDGTAWAANSPVTVDRYLGKFKGTHDADGSRTKKGKARAGVKKPGTGESRALQQTIHAQLVGNDTVSIGSTLPYAAMFNYGGKRSEFPHLWGDIPARDFLSLSHNDQENIVSIVGRYLLGA